MTDTKNKPDKYGNHKAREGVTRCDCGCKYWQYDRCVDCGQHVTWVLR